MCSDPPGPGAGRPCLPDDIDQDVEQFLVQSSAASTTRTVKSQARGGEDIPVRRMQQSFSQAYQEFPRRHELSKRAFYSKVGRQFKQTGLVRRVATAMIRRFAKDLLLNERGHTPTCVTNPSLTL